MITLLFLPLFGINVNGCHDWGGDFAQYIHHAINILGEKSYGDTGYIYNPDNLLIGPQNYPVGFPLLLSPIIAVFGNNILILQLFISLFFIVFSLLLFNLARLYTGFLSALIISFAVGYNHLLLDFKDEIMADLPFVAIITSILLLLLQKNCRPRFAFILIAILSLFAILTKEAGLFLIPVIFVIIIASYFKINIGNAGLIQSNRWAYQLGFFVFLIIIPPIISYLTTGNFMNSGYLNLLEWKNLGLIISKNAVYYFEVFNWMFSPFNFLNPDSVFNPSLILFLLVFMGFLKKIIFKFDIIDLFFISYLVMILMYPYVGSGFRFLIPILPFVAIYIIEILKLPPQFPKKIKHVVLLFILVFVLYSNYKPITHIIANQKLTILGPQHPLSVEIFEIVKNKTPKESVIMFFKPRVLSLYAERKTIAEIDTQYLNFESTLNKFSVDYLLVYKPESKLNSNHWAHFELVFENEYFMLFKID